MATTAPNTSFEQLASTTLKNYRNVLADNLTGHQAFLTQLRELGFIREESGGESIVEQLMYAGNSTVASYADYDLLNISPQRVISAAEFLWKQIAGSVTTSGIEEFKNMGESRLINLLEAKIMNLDISMQLEVNSQLFGNGTGNDGKDLTGLNLAVEDGAAWSTYGGIDSSTTANAFWRNTWLSFSGTDFATSSGSSTEGMDALRSSYNSCSRGKEVPTLGVTTQDLYEQYEANAEGQKLRFTDVALADMGFENIKFKRTPIVFDEDCPSATWFWLNAKYMRFVVGKGKNFTVTPFENINSNQDARVSHVYLYANLTCNNRERQGRIGNFVASA